MLIITRKKGDSLMIGDDIEITISKIDDGSVKIGINAPKEIVILRKELYEAIKNENKQAINIDINLLKNIKRD
ncbi:carbon storage regulator CsrA [Clostridium beijerinckii]|uniref:carbon storage regulator CsrA n=1 Tax=Clostridium beijerinckii TaxID=1520 RepID=UPI00156D5E6F|nr:carbon storage regulator CsrA [Clostridium beijerinckii]NRT73724.1 carbon storage regulator [Clostridium beijerinckii]